MSTDKKLTLIDAENNISYNIIVSKEDAEKASKDMIFAHSLLLQAKRSPNDLNLTSKQTTDVKITRPYKKEAVDDPEPGQSNKDRNSGEDSGHSSGSYSWNRAETLLSIASYKELENDFISGKMTKAVLE